MSQKQNQSVILQYFGTNIGVIQPGPKVSGTSVITWRFPSPPFRSECAPSWHHVFSSEKFQNLPNRSKELHPSIQFINYINHISSLILHLPSIISQHTNCTNYHAEMLGFTFHLLWCIVFHPSLLITNPIISSDIFYITASTLAPFQSFTKWPWSSSRR
jgi:hypothetical protein